MQDSTISFINLNNNDKRTLLSNITRTDIFDKIVQEVKNSKNINGRFQGKYIKKLEEYKRYGQDKEVIKKEIDRIKRKLLEYEKEQEENTKYQTINIQKITEYETKIKSISNKKDIKKMQKIKTEIENKILKDKEKIKKVGQNKKNIIEKNEIEIKLQEITILRKKIRYINQTIQKYDKNKYNKMINSKPKIEKKIKQIEINIKNLREKILKNNLEQNKEKYEEFIQDIKDIEKIQAEIINITKKITKCEKIIDQFKEYKYDKNCVYCNNNSLTKQKEYIELEKKEYLDMLKDYTDQIKNKNDNIEKNREIFDNYEKIEKDKESNKIIEDRILNKNLKLSQKQNKLLNVEKIIKEFDVIKENNKIIEENTEIENNIKKIEEDIEKIREIEELNKNLQENIEKLKEINLELEEQKESIEIKNKLDIIQKENIEYFNKIKENRDNYEKEKKNEMQLEFDNKQIDEITKEIKKIEIDEADYKILIEIFNNGGIIDNLFEKQIIPKLEEIVNDIIEDIDYLKIKISYVNKEINITNNNKSSIQMNGGYVNKLLNIVFRVALTKLGNYIRPNFIILDETFDSCSSEGINNVRKLIEKIKTHYKYILAITHNSELISTEDKILILQNKDKNRKIQI
jgi:DNA repair exonuclease SbcCD ATPase subunit